MEKKYTYDNCIIYVTNTNINYERVYKAAEDFLKKVIKEKTQNGRYKSNN